ncbi:MAG: DUF167 domain-containing protein [Thermoplasmatota archaeon]
MWTSVLKRFGAWCDVGMPPDITRAVRETRTATDSILEIEVVPNASRNRFPSAFNPWRGRIAARVRAPPEGGRANEELVQTVATFFSVPASRVRITHGATDRQKTILVVGIDPAAARKMIGDALAGAE